MMTETSGSAVISEDELYRYRLRRTWDEATVACSFIMLNPSTADGTVDDPTIRRCVGFAKAMGYGGLNVANLYAFRAAKPDELWKAQDPVGPENDDHLTAISNYASYYGALLIAAWGVNARPDRIAAVMKLPFMHRMSALGTTKAGAPRHPLYLPADTRAERWPK